MSGWDRGVVLAGFVTAAVATPAAYVTVGELQVVALYAVGVPLASIVAGKFSGNTRTVGTEGDRSGGGR